MKNPPSTSQWGSIRRTLADSLREKKQCSIKGVESFLSLNPEYLPIMNDLIRFAQICNIGLIHFDNGSLLFQPKGLYPGIFEFETGESSSISDILLFVMPALAELDFRSILRLKGVTHPAASLPTAFIKDSLLYFLEDAGIYGSLNLKRFGFNASGGGEVEARIYPSELKNIGSNIFNFSLRQIEGARILIQGADTSLAVREKGILADIGMPGDKISVLEIASGRGFGNWIFVQCRGDGLPVLFYTEIPFYNSAGDFIFDEDRIPGIIDGLKHQIDDFLERSMLPCDLKEEFEAFTCDENSFK